MKFIFHNLEIQAVKFSTRHDFDNYVSNRSIEYLTLVDDFNDKCVLIDIFDLIKGNSAYCYYSIEDNSDERILFSNNRLLFLLGKEVIGLTDNFSSILFNNKLSTAATSIIENVENNTFLIIGEAEVLSIDKNGKIQWQVMTDLIANYQLSRTHIELQFYDAKPVAYNRLTGQANG